MIVNMRRLIMIVENAMSGVSPAFRRWFGASKVVNADGTPMVMYHGTTSNFNTFTSDAHFGTKAQAGEILSSQQRKSEGGQHIMPVYLRIEKPKRVEDKIGVNWPEEIKKAKAEGHDGLVYNNWGEFDPDAEGNPHDSYIVFSPGQIKSAIGNNGAFNPDDLDISESEHIR